jgi:TrmH family RNA methyltransferase
LLITSLRNPRVKALRSLRHRKYRYLEGHFLIEGIRIVEEALTCEAPLETLIYAPDLLVSHRAQSLVDQVGPTQRLALSGEVFCSLSDRDNPQGIAATVRIEDRPLGAIPIGEDMLVIVAYQLRDPGNLGSIIRTADAAGASGVIIVGPSVDLYDPQAVRATMGSLFALPIVRLEASEPLSAWYKGIRTEGLPLLVAATSAHGQQISFEADLSQPVILLVGSERHGLPGPVQAGADTVLGLPMRGRATSLNVSAATAALVFEIIRQRYRKAS